MPFMILQKNGRKGRVGVAETGRDKLRKHKQLTTKLRVSPDQAQSKPRPSPDTAQNKPRTSSE